MPTRRRLLIGVSLLVAAFAVWAHWPSSPLPEGTRADRVVVKKSVRVLELYHGDRLVRVYPISLGRNPLGHKQREGDGRTPDGQYVLDYRKGDSSFHRALHVSYPSAVDTAAARANGVDPGGLIMVHGMRNGLGFVGRLHTWIDWTDGCIAVTNAQIEEIWRVEYAVL